MKTTAASVIDRATPLQPNYPRPARFSAVPMRTVPIVSSPPTSNPRMAMGQYSFVAPNHVHPCYQVTPTLQDFQTHRSPAPSEMPPLAYEPLPIIRQTATTNPRHFGNSFFRKSSAFVMITRGLLIFFCLTEMIRTSKSEEDIAISVVDVGDELPRVKLTLNERFTQ